MVLKKFQIIIDMLYLKFYYTLTSLKNEKKTVRRSCRLAAKEINQ